MCGVDPIDSRVDGSGMRLMFESSARAISQADTQQLSKRSADVRNRLERAESEHTSEIDAAKAENVTALRRAREGYVRGHATVDMSKRFSARRALGGNEES